MLLLALACSDEIKPLAKDFPPDPGSTVWTETATPSLGTSTGSTGSTGDTAEIDGSSTLPQRHWVTIGAGRLATCGIDDQGSVACRSTGASSLPAAPAGEFTDVAVSWGTACAVRADSRVACWGCRQVGKMLCAPPADSGYQRIKGADDLFCAQKADDTLTCWGGEEQPDPSEPFLDFDISNTGFVGMRPDGTLLRLGEAPDLAGNYTVMAAGWSYICAVDASGDTTCTISAPNGIPTAGIASMDGYRQGLCWTLEDGTTGCAHDAFNPDLARDGFDPDTIRFSQVSTGEDHACGVTEDGEGYCWPAGKVYTDWPVRP